MPFDWQVMLQTPISTNPELHEKFTIALIDVSFVDIKPFLRFCNFLQPKAKRSIANSVCKLKYFKKPSQDGSVPDQFPVE